MGNYVTITPGELRDGRHYRVTIDDMGADLGTTRTPRQQVLACRVNAAGPSPRGPLDRSGPPQPSAEAQLPRWMRNFFSAFRG